MNIQALQTDGPYCSISSYLQDMRIPWVPSDETNIAATFAREVAKMRTPLWDAYEQVRRDDWMEPGGFK